jgi:predicted branched-subunit amino acid permease
MNNKLKIFSKGIIDVSPLMIPVIPFGIIFGVLAIDMGLTPYATMAMSIILFGGASSLVILSSVGAVNSRHLLYGAVLSEHLSGLRLTWKIIVSYFLVDQAFIISNDYLKKSKDENKHFHLLGSGFTCWFIWQTTTFLGIILGSIIPAKLGLTFAIPLTFLALLVNDFRKLINLIVIAVSGAVATFGYQIIPFKSYVIVAALSGLFVAFILTKFIGKKND